MQRLGLDYCSSLVYVFFFSSLALGSPEGLLYIKKLVAEKVTSTNQTDIVNFFTENVIYRFGTELTFNGLDALRSAFTNTSQMIPQNAITTQGIDLLPPFDEQGAASAGTGVVYFTTTTPGQGGFAGQALILFVKFEEKYVRTGDIARYGGWRISERDYILISNAGNPDVLSPGERAQIPSDLLPPSPTGRTHMKQ